MYREVCALRDRTNCRIVDVQDIIEILYRENALIKIYILLNILMKRTFEP